MHVFFVFFISVFSCVYLAPAGSLLGPLCSCQCLLWLPGAPEDFFTGICWQINAAGLTNCSHSGCHQPQCTLNTKRWPWAFCFSLLFPTNVHTRTNNVTSSRKTTNFRWAQLEEKVQIQPKIWIKTLILNSRGSDLTRNSAWPLLYSSLPFLSCLSLSVTPFLSFSLSLACCLKFWTAVSHCEKGGK